MQTVRLQQSKIAVCQTKAQIPVKVHARVGHKVVMHRGGSEI